MIPLDSLQPLPAYGDLMLLEEFVTACQTRSLIDYDGDGRWATNTSYAPRTVVQPSDVLHGLFRPDDWVTHVVWFNR